jgi:hypothetical protein
MDGIADDVLASANGVVRIGDVVTAFDSSSCADVFVIRILFWIWI